MTGRTSSDTIPVMEGMEAFGAKATDRPCESATLRRLRRGDQDMFGRICEQFRPELVEYCARILQNHSDAEDAVQLVLLSVHRALASDASVVQLRPWLYRIARNRCISMLRTRRDPVATEDHLEASTPSLEEHVQRREALRELVSDIRELPELQRSAVALAFFGGLRGTTIAEILGCQPARVRALIFQGRAHLNRARTQRAEAHSLDESVAEAA